MMVNMFLYVTMIYNILGKIGISSFGSMAMDV